jgi:tetratricopeptide (TPR) repeat protein
MTQLPFAGRLRELKELRRELESGSGRLVLISGNPGMGKTALLQEFRRELELAIEGDAQPFAIMDFEIARDEDPAAIFDRIISVVEDAIQNTAGFFSVTPRGKAQLRAIIDSIPVADSAANLIASLQSSKSVHSRYVLLDFLHELSTRMPDGGRAVLFIDANKFLRRDSVDSWRIIAEKLPSKVLLLVTQRPDDSLCRDADFLALRNVIKIPPGGLDPLDEADLKNLIDLAQDGDFCSPEDAEELFQLYDGHPYAISAGVDLLADGTPIDELPRDPTPSRVAKSQWEHALRSGNGTTIASFLVSLAVLDIPSNRRDIQRVAHITDEEVSTVLANQYIQTLLKGSQETFSLYHSILRDEILDNMGEEPLLRYHERCIELYSEQLGSDQINPDVYLTAASEIGKHIETARGTEEAAAYFSENCARGLVRAGRLSTVESYAHDLLGRLKHDSLQAAPLFCNLGIVAIHRGDLDSADEFHNRALTIDSEANNLPAIAIHFRNLATVARDRRDFRRANELVSDSLKICVELGDRLGAADAMQKFTTICLDQGDLRGAKHYANEAQSIFEEIGDEISSAGQLLELGLILQQEGDLEAARSSFQDSFNIFSEHGLILEAANAECNLAVALDYLGDSESATKHFGHALEVFEECNSPLGVARTAQSLGMVYHCSGELQKAQVYFEKALEANLQIGRKGKAAISASCLQLLAERTGDSDAASHFLNITRGLMPYVNDVDFGQHLAALTTMIVSKE